MPGALLAHVPPDTVLVSVLLEPKQEFNEPPIGVGPRFTVAEVVKTDTQPAVLVSVSV